MGKVEISHQRAVHDNYNKQVTEESFIRNALVTLYAAYDTDLDIDQVQLSPVETEDDHFLVCVSNYDLDYTADIGYSHKEVCPVEERVYRDGEFHKEIVFKEQVLTRWEPFHGTAQDVQCRHYHKLDADVSDFDAGQVLNKPFVRYMAVNEQEKAAFPQIDEKDVLDKANYHPCQRDTAFNSFRDNHLPGDTHKNFKPTWKVASVHAGGVVVEKFHATFEYRGKKCDVHQYATEEEATAVYPSTKDDVKKNAKKNQEEEIKNDPTIAELKKKQEKLPVPCLAAGGAFLLLAMLISNLFIVFLALMVGAVASWQIITKMLDKKIKQREEEIKAQYAGLLRSSAGDLKDQKIALLNARFEKMGLKKLTKAELERFDDQVEFEEYIDNNEMWIDDDEDEDEDDEDEDDE